MMYLKVAVAITLCTTRGRRSGCAHSTSTAYTDLFLFLQPELTSTPNFVVEVTKSDGKKTLVLDCHYPEDEVCGWSIFWSHVD